MKFLKTVLAATALTAMAATAQAQDSNAYINVGIDAVEFDSYNISAKIGYNFTQNFAVEGQGAFGVIDDEIEDVDVGIDNSFAAFAKASLPLEGGSELFVRGGYHFTQIGGESGGVGASVDTDGFALGGGGQYMFTDRDGVRLEYTYYDLNVDEDLTDESGSANVYSLSYVRKF
jgi:opacity protein-like surface antigen